MPAARSAARDSPSPFPACVRGDSPPRLPMWPWRDSPRGLSVFDIGRDCPWTRLEGPMTAGGLGATFAGVARVARNVLPSYGVFHVTARGVDRCAIYRDADDYAFFEHLLMKVRKRERLRIEAYCFMPNHFHAIVEAELDRLSRAMHWLNGLYAQAF